MTALCIADMHSQHGGVATDVFGCVGVGVGVGVDVGVDVGVGVGVGVGVDVGVGVTIGVLLGGRFCFEFKRNTTANCHCFRSN